MMRNIPLKCLIGSFALVSLTGCDVFANKGFCQKTDQGYEICIKKENISCKEFGWGRGKFRINGYNCSGSGVSTSLSGDENHWVNSSDDFCLVYNGNLDSESKRRIICGAAEHFGMVKKY